MGITLDKELNSGTMGVEKVISDEDSRVKLLVVPTDEELVIARDTYRLYREDAEN